VQITGFDVNLGAISSSAWKVDVFYVAVDDFTDLTAEMMGYGPAMPHLGWEKIASVNVASGSTSPDTPYPIMIDSDKFVHIPYGDSPEDIKVGIFYVLANRMKVQTTPAVANTAVYSDASLTVLAGYASNTAYAVNPLTDGAMMSLNVKYTGICPPPPSPEPVCDGTLEMPTSYNSGGNAESSSGYVFGLEVTKETIINSITIQKNVDDTAQVGSLYYAPFGTDADKPSEDIADYTLLVENFPVPANSEELTISGVGLSLASGAKVHVYIKLNTFKIRSEMANELNNKPLYMNANLKMLVGFSMKGNDQIKTEMRQLMMTIDAKTICPPPLPDLGLECSTTHVEPSSWRKNKEGHMMVGGYMFGIHAINDIEVTSLWLNQHRMRAMENSATLGKLWEIVDIYYAYFDSKEDIHGATGADFIKVADEYEIRGDAKKPIPNKHREVPITASPIPAGKYGFFYIKTTQGKQALEPTLVYSNEPSYANSDMQVLVGWKVARDFNVDDHSVGMLVQVMDITYNRKCEMPRRELAEAEKATTADFASALPSSVQSMVPSSLLMCAAAIAALVVGVTMQSISLLRRHAKQQPGKDLSTRLRSGRLDTSASRTNSTV
jgi:hypothetical protein